MQRIIIKTVGGGLALTTGQLAIVAGVAVVAIFTAAWLVDRICEEHDVHIEVGGTKVDLV